MSHGESRPDLPGLRADDEPVFEEPWQAQAFAMAVTLNERGVFAWGEWADAFGARLAEGEDYWPAWLATLEAMMACHDIASPERIDALEAKWHEAAARTPHGEPIVPGD